MLPSSVRTALDLQRALSMAPFRLQEIGDCKTRAHLFKERYAYLDASCYEDETPSTPPKHVSDPNEPYVRELCEIYKEHGSDSWNDTLDTPFRLTVTRPGCEFSGDIIPKSEEEDKEAIAERLRKWYEHGAISGFGDVRAQETKVDKKVRDAREISASEFTVSDSLVEEVKKHWGEHFIPSAVRVEPYKIHIYGPGGLFEFHRDTPERDLVGTFLVGLGDNCEGGLLIIGHDDYYDPYSRGAKAHPGSCAAFYPDTVHRVDKIKKGQRAVIAFKVFRTGDTAMERSGYRASPEAALPQQKMEDVLGKMQLPFGVLLAHKYCIGTVELNGLDNFLHAAAEAMAKRSNAQLHFLPVLTKLEGSVYLPEDHLPKNLSVSAPVYPLTQAHVDALLASIAEDTETSDAFAEFVDDRTYLRVQQNPAYDIAPKPEQDVIEVPNADEWLAGLSGVPFYPVDFTRSSVVWKTRGETGAAYTGNESRPWTEDSIYLSYAMVVLSNDPAPKDLKRKRDQK